MTERKNNEGWLRVKNDEKPILIEIPENFNAEEALSGNRAIIFTRVYKNGSTGKIIVSPDQIASLSFNDF